MKYFEFNGIKLSKIALGAANFGTTVSKEKSYELMDEYIANGGNIIDTARVYASWVEGGDRKSEETIGDYLQDRNNRNKVFLVTKGGHPRFESMNKSRLTKEEVESDLNESLESLKTNYVDLYFLHRDDEKIPAGQIIEYLNTFIKEGKVKYLGASNWTMKRILEANKYAKEHGLVPFTFSQIMYGFARIYPNEYKDPTLVTMDQIEYEQYCKENIIVMAYTSQSKGFFSNLDKGIDSISEKDKKTYLSQLNLKRYEAIKNLGLKDVSNTAVSTAVIFNKKEFQTIAIIGVSSLEHLSDSLKALELSEEDIKPASVDFTY